MFSYGPPCMAEQKLRNQLELTNSSSVSIWNVALRTCQKWWMIRWSDERGSGISVLVAQQDDDDDHYFVDLGTVSTLQVIHISIHIFISLHYISNVCNCSRGWPEGFLFNNYYTKELGRLLLLSLDCSTLPLISTLYCWVFSKEI